MPRVPFSERPISMRPLMYFSPEMRPILDRPRPPQQILVSTTQVQTTRTCREQAIKWTWPIAVITASLSAVGTGTSVLCLFSGDPHIVEGAEIAGSVCLVIGVVSGCFALNCKS